jgi:D-tyrosyl-tRNA(Tyr) deacylase
VLATPALQGITAGVTQLSERGLDAIAQLDIELNGSDSIFVGIHELLAGSPSFCAHTHGNWLQSLRYAGPLAGRGVDHCSLVTAMSTSHQSSLIHCATLGPF